MPNPTFFQTKVKDGVGHRNSRRKPLAKAIMEIGSNLLMASLQICSCRVRPDTLRDRNEREMVFIYLFHDAVQLYDGIFDGHRNTPWTPGSPSWPASQIGGKQMSEKIKVMFLFGRLNQFDCCWTDDGEIE
jgi:hypothetical protein